MRRAVLTATLAVALSTGGAATLPGSVASASGAGHGFPAILPLPNGFQPEGVETGPGATFYAGSLVDGAIYRGSLRTGAGAVFIPGTAGNAATGLELAGRRLFVSGGSTAAARVYSARTGALLASYQLGTAGSSFVNDVVVTRRAAYFTDSLQPVVYVLPFGRGGRLPAPGGVRVLPLTGDLVYTTGFNANGIETTPDGRALLIVQSNTGGLFRVSPRTGAATTVDLGGASLTNGDGLLRRGRTLYAVRNRLNEIPAIRLNRAGTAGTVVRTITDPALDVPTTVAGFGPFLYAVNARFGTTPTTETEYDVVRLPAR